VLHEARLRRHLHIAVPLPHHRRTRLQHHTRQPLAGPHLRSQLARRHAIDRLRPDDAARFVVQPDRAVVGTQQLARMTQNARKQRPQLQLAADRVDERAQALLLPQQVGQLLRRRAGYVRLPDLHALRSVRESFIAPEGGAALLRARPHARPASHILHARTRLLQRCRLRPPPNNRVPDARCRRSPASTSVRPTTSSLPPSSPCDARPSSPCSAWRPPSSRRDDAPPSSPCHASQSYASQSYASSRAWQSRAWQSRASPPSSRSRASPPSSPSPSVQLSSLPRCASGNGGFGLLRAPRIMPSR